MSKSLVHRPWWYPKQEMMASSCVNNCSYKNQNKTSYKYIFVWVNSYVSLTFDKQSQELGHIITIFLMNILNEDGTYGNILI